MTIKEIFDIYKNIAVVGMSTNSSKPAQKVPAYLHSKGYNIIPVNPMADEIIGLKAYKNIADIPDNIDIVNVFRPSNDALAVVEKAVERKKSKGDVKLIWLQEGIINDNAKKLAEDNGIEFIQDKCMHKEYANM
jgi:uncharacterized protein